MNHQQAKAKMLKDPALKAAYEKGDLAFEVAKLVTDMRIEAGLTQEELAEKAGTKQPAIARLESGDKLPSLGFLERLTKAMGHEIEVKVKKPVSQTPLPYISDLELQAYLEYMYRQGAELEVRWSDSTVNTNDGNLSVRWRWQSR